MDLDIRPITRKESTTKMIYNSYIITGIEQKLPTRGKFTKRYTVVCRDINRAIALCLKDYPDFEIQSIAHQGQIQRIEV